MTEPNTAKDLYKEQSKLYSTKTFEVILMAKKMFGETCCTCAPWFGILVLLVGIWFMAADLGWLTTGGLTLWPVVLALIGLKMLFVK